MNTKPIALIRVGPALPAVDLLLELGVPVERLWRRAGLPPTTHLAPERLVPFNAVREFLELTAAAEGMDDLGVRLAHRSGLAGIGAFGRAICRAPTLHAALETARFGVVRHNSSAQYWTIVQGDTVRLCRRFAGNERHCRQIDLQTVILMIELVRAVAGEDWRPERIEFQSTGTAGLDGAAAFGKATIDVTRPVTSITFPRALLARGLPRPATAVVDGDLGSAPPSDFLASLEVVIANLLETERLEVEAAANAAGASVRTLQRRLTELGVSFSELVDRVRFRIATDLLRDDGIKIIDIALAAGYSDPAHFTRAFRRWTSLTPLEYRRAERDGSHARETA